MCRLGLGGRLLPMAWRPAVADGTGHQALISAAGATGLGATLGVAAERIVRSSAGRRRAAFVAVAFGAAAAVTAVMTSPHEAIILSVAVPLALTVAGRMGLKWA